LPASVPCTKKSGPCCAPADFAGAPAWARSGDPHFTISGLLRIGHSAANNRFLAAMPVGTLASTARMRRKSGTGAGGPRELAVGCIMPNDLPARALGPDRVGSTVVRGARCEDHGRQPGRAGAAPPACLLGERHVGARPWSRRRMPRLPGRACPRRALGSVPRLRSARSRMPIPSGQCTAGSSTVGRGTACVFPAAMRFTHCRLYGQRPMTECRREPQGDSLLVGHRIDSVNDGLAVEQLVLPGTAFRLPAYGMLALAPCLPPSPAPATGKLPGDIAGIAVGVTVA